jgi:hypothetical protein
MLTEYTLDDTMVGRVLDPPDGFVTALSMTTPPVADGPPRASPGGTWLSGRIQLCGESDWRDLVCSDSLDIGGWSGKTKVLIADSSYPYRGGLVIKAVPKGAVYQITLSDVPNDRASLATPPTARRAGAMRDAVTTPV